MVQEFDPEEGGADPITLDPAQLLQQAASLNLFPQRAVQTIGNYRSGEAWDDIEDLGASPDQIRKTECYLLLVVLDDSGSMQGAESETVEAYNAFLNDYKQAKASEQISSDVLIAVAALNRGIMYPYTRIEDAQPLSPYYADGGTPLYDVTLKAHGLQIAKTTELSLYGVNVKTVTLLITDGYDEHSRAPVGEVKKVIESVQENRNHIVGGIYRGRAREETFTNMGIPKKWVLDGGGSGSALLNAFSRFSRASRSALTAGAGAGVTVS